VSESPKVYLAACLAYRNEAPYLREWIEFHRLVGVERFFLYNHASVDEHRAALAPYVEDGLVTVEDWPDLPAAQPDIFNRCLEDHSEDSRWIAFLDMDEFLFSPTHRPLSEVLLEYEDFPGVVAQWANFGTSGHRTKPDALVIEGYVWRSDDPARPGDRLYKCVVDPKRVQTCHDPHTFSYVDGPAVDELKRPVTSQFTDGQLGSKIRINHYYTRSEEEAVRKFARPGGADGLIRQGGKPPLETLHETLNQKRDDSIALYAPAVKKALAEVNGRAPFDEQRAAADAERRFAQTSVVRKANVHNWESGSAALRCIDAARGSADRLLPQTADLAVDRILDVRCGRGQVVRVLKTAFPDAEMTARDTDTDAVDFCAEALGAVPLYAPNPARVETDTLFDLIWCGGVFSHLDAESWRELLQSLESRLRPWGLLLFTTLGRHHAFHVLAEELGPEPAREMRTEYAELGFSYRGDPGRSGWGTALASPAWVCRLVEARPGLRLLAYAERGWNLSEDTVACVRVGPRMLITELLEERPGITERELSEVTGYDEPTIRSWLERGRTPAES
jgi:SAM-dependent methyltransferase